MQMQPGRYYLGDPCYLYGHSGDQQEEWLKLCAVGFDVPYMAVLTTEWGDGEYCDDRDSETRYLVDSGCLGAVRIDGPESESMGRLKELLEIPESLRYFKVIEFSEPFECFTTEGIIVLGSVEIDTDPDDQGYDEYSLT